MKKKILITGGKGMLGQYFEEFPFCHITQKEVLDVTNLKSILKYIKLLKANTIIHLAAETDVDFCQQNPDIAYKVNAQGAKNVSLAAKIMNCLLVYLSTATVFSGKGSKPFKVDDIPNPVNVYAKSKLEGEILIRRIAPKYLIVRTGWVFGGFERDKRFVSLIANQIWSGAKKVFAVDDSFGCPTYGKDLASAILKLIDDEYTGIVHVVNKGYTSRFELASKIAKNLNPSILVEVAKPNMFPSFSAPRPKFQVIEPTVVLRSWQKALREYLEEWIKLRKSQNP